MSSFRTSSGERRGASLDSLKGWTCHDKSSRQGRVTSDLQRHRDMMVHTWLSREVACPGHRLLEMWNRKPPRLGLRWFGLRRTWRYRTDCSILCTAALKVLAFAVGVVPSSRARSGASTDCADAAIANLSSTSNASTPHVLSLTCTCRPAVQLLQRD